MSLADQPNNKRKIRVLIVDDDEDDVLIIKKMLQRGELNDLYDVHWCESAEAAVKKVRRKEHDVYLIDYRLGGMSGLDMLESIQPELRTEPFILMTGADDTSIRNRSMNAAAADFLVKGKFTADSLLTTINFALRRKEFERQRVEHLMEVNRSKDDFISIASHQLRTPATAVKQYLGMLRDGMFGEMSEEQTRILNKAYDSNERQLAIVADLLRVARLDAGKITLKPEPCNIVELIESVVDDLQNEIKGRRQIITIDVVQVDCVAIDIDAMRMVLDNIIENASKYSHDKGKIAIAISRDANNDSVRIEVADDGVGVSDQDVRLLFEKFRRIPNQLSAKVGGTGLGLYWAKKIVDLHGGEIAYKQNQGGGSRFIVTLPCSQVKKEKI